jgi:DNA transposition AAA+ family ATPase
VLARTDHIGVSRAALDGVIKGTYFLPKELGGEGVDPKKSKVEPAIRAYKERVEGTVRHGYSNTFLQTRTWYQIVQACTTAINENVIVVVYGRPGVGKTRGLREYSTQHMKTLPVTVLCSRNITVRYLVQKIAQELKLDDRPTTAKLEDTIAEKLKRQPRPIFIDQANYLDERGLGTVCHLWEIARVPIVLAGTRDLYELFTTSRLTEDVRAQLSSRVALHYPLAELQPEEVNKIVRRVLGDEATDEDIAQLYNVTGGIHRHIDQILPRVLELKNRKSNKERLAKGELTLLKIIEAAGTKLMIA